MHAVMTGEVVVAIAHVLSVHLPAALGARVLLVGRILARKGARARANVGVTTPTLGTLRDVGWGP